MLRFEPDGDELNVMDDGAKIGSIYKKLNTVFVFCTIDIPIALYTSDLREILEKLDELNRAGEGT